MRRRRRQPQRPSAPAMKASRSRSADGLLPHLHPRDVALLLVSQAPLAKIQAGERRMGWSISVGLGGGHGLHLRFRRTRHPGADARLGPRRGRAAADIPGYPKCGGLFTRSREPNSRSGAATIATPATQAADHKAGRRAVINRASLSWPPRLWPQRVSSGPVFLFSSALRVNIRIRTAAVPTAQSRQADWRQGRPVTSA